MFRVRLGHLWIIAGPGHDGDGKSGGSRNTQAESLAIGRSWSWRVGTNPYQELFYAFSRGCEGGNSLLGFYFILKAGVINGGLMIIDVVSVRHLPPPSAHFPDLLDYDSDGWHFCTAHHVTWLTQPWKAATFGPHLSSDRHTLPRLPSLCSLSFLSLFMTLWIP